MKFHDDSIREYCSHCETEIFIEYWDGKFVKKCPLCGETLLICSECASIPRILKEKGCDWNNTDGCWRERLERSKT